MAGARLLQSLDGRAFLDLDVWEFSLHSLWRPYGRLFFRSVLLRHPWRALAGLRTYRRRIRPGRRPGYSPIGEVSPEALEAELASSEWVLGVGFCEKPLDPPCPSGRFNHRCWLLAQPDADTPPAACQRCRIREVAMHALPAGATVHVMTSAVDFAHDVLLPGLRSGCVRPVVLSICPFSVPPITLALTICGFRGLALSYTPGVCQDFVAWVRADEGFKPEQTGPSLETHHRLLALLDRVAALRSGKGSTGPRRFRERGNFYVPVA